MDKKTIRNYYYNLCSENEVYEVERWLSTIKHNSEDDELLRSFLSELQIDKDISLNKAAFDKFESTISDKRDKSFIHRIGKIYRYAAAVLIIPLLLAAVYLYVDNKNPKEWVEEYVPYGKSKMVQLPDESKIWLNAGTKLIYPKKFNNSLRQVYVAGEAYAEIEKDKSRPFIMSAGEVSIEVLGTKFNVKSYSEDDNIAVSLIEGSIRMSTNHKNEINTRLLKPGEIVKFNKLSGEIVKSEFMIASRTQWYNGKGFYFIDESLQEISSSLERYFDVRIIIENESLKSERFYSIFINNESIDDILSALNASGKMKIRKTPGIIYIN
ncbi:FecR family protein [Marinifilum sp.]|uniref:FecR family protein n=1 Tax=Marinifilum sp. TaxID=2033137 RepID=UPI003BAA770F